MTEINVLRISVAIMFFLCKAPSNAQPRMRYGRLPALNVAAPIRKLGDDALPKAQDIPQRLPELAAGYIYPIMIRGPNNQIAGLKEALVLGRLLNRTVIVHDIRNHYQEKTALGPYSPPPSLNFSLVFDLPHLARHHSVVTLAEHRAAGWDGKLDAVIHFGNGTAGETKNARMFNVSITKAKFINFGMFHCNGQMLDTVRNKLSPYPYVGSILYQNILQFSGRAVHVNYELNVCHEEFLKVSSNLIRSPTLKSLATSFRESHLGGVDKRYAAVHIRPYPDACAAVWISEGFDNTLAKRRCYNPNLYYVVGNQTVAAMHQYGLSLLFVMTQPELRPWVAKLYRDVGLSPVFIEEKPILEELGYVSVSLIGMVEEEIALESDVFIGTHLSSMSGVIMQDRAAANKPLEKTLTFKDTTVEFLPAR